MAYIGVQPTDTYLSIASQQITGTGSATYTLDYSVSNEEDVAVFVNNVRQNVSTYTVSGTSLTLGGTISASDSCWVLFLGRTVGTKTPAVGSVTNDMLAGSIATSKLADITANGLTNINYQTFTSSGTYTPTTGMAFCEVYCTGGGGGAGGTDGDDTSCSLASGGGGAGGTAIKIYSATEIGASATVTIGSGGSGGNGATSGSSGGNSTFSPAGTGGTLTGGGGNGSSGFNAGGDEARRGADGGGSSGGDLNLSGEHGHHGETSNDGVIGGNGGSSFFERGGLASDRARTNGSGSTGVAGSKGSGGGGTVVRNDTGTSTGGAGGSGFVVVKEFING